MPNNSHCVLVVEDEKPLLVAIQKKLELEGFEVVTARSTAQALEYLSMVDGIACIWLDHYLLGKESGLDLVRQLKGQNAKYRQIPIYVVSNTAGADKIQAYLQLGVSKYFTKSDFRLDEIIADIKKDLGGGGE